MSRWYSKNLGEAMFAHEPLAELRERFAAAWARAGEPGDMAVFVRHESEGRLHCEVRAYFSPAAAVLAEEVGAAPCGKPSRDGLSLFAGSEGSWQMLFSQGDR